MIDNVGMVIETGKAYRQGHPHPPWVKIRCNSTEYDLIVRRSLLL